MGPNSLLVVYVEPSGKSRTKVLAPVQAATLLHPSQPLQNPSIFPFDFPIIGTYLGFYTALPQTNMETTPFEGLSSFWGPFWVSMLVSGNVLLFLELSFAPLT